MVRIRWVSLILCFVNVVVIARPKISQAELLAQLYHSAAQPSRDQGPFFNFNFIFDAAASFENQVRLGRMPTAADIGQTFAADPAMVRKFNEILTGSSGVGITSGLGLIGTTTRDAVARQFFDGPYMADFPSTHSPETTAFIMKAFVPQLGPNFAGYVITGVHQTIHGFSIDQPNPGGLPRYWGAQTIRIFGERIPEPSSGTIAITGFGFAVLRVGTWRRCVRRP